MSQDCSFHRTTRDCNYTCFPCTFMHGIDGNSGLWATTGVPKRYKSCRLDNLPIAEANPKAYNTIKKYVENVLLYVQDKGVGLLLYSLPTDENHLGTGTGKTTSAITILNHFVIERSRAYFRGQQAMEANPALFVKATELQNAFNAQFRGTKEMQEQASRKYYGLKNKVKQTELVVLDDIATRDSKLSEAYSDEVYEMIDYRAVNGLTTIYTANVNLEDLKKSLGERTASRIAGMTVALGFTGVDNRLDALFK